MVWCLISMLLGATIFAAGFAFDKLMKLPMGKREQEHETEEPMNKRLLRQWENLLEYDGTEQEVNYEDR